MDTESLNSKKTISISSKNQITIPKKIIEYLGFGKEATIKIIGNSLIVTPIKETTGEFSEQILSELIEEGYSGVSLLEEFKIRQSQIRPAVLRMLAEIKKEDCVKFSEVFEDD
jgi:bifunctional DNA-binding transcriptional regulator/antitoxin component of YhaV-PrlF toxin-antitoxin module